VGDLDPRTCCARLLMLGSGVLACVNPTTTVTSSSHAPLAGPIELLAETGDRIAHLRASCPILKHDKPCISAALRAFSLIFSVTQRDDFYQGDPIPTVRLGAA